MKTRSKKIMSMIVIVLLALIIVFALLIKLFGDRALKIGIETGASSAMKVPVTLDSVSLSILAGKLDLNNLVVKNPQGYENPTFLELGHGYVGLKTGSLLSDTIEIEKIQLDNISLTIEQKGLNNNLKEILNNLPKSEANEPAAGEKPGKKLLIKQLDINGIEVKVKLLPVPGRADTLTLKVNPIHLENLGSGEKLDMKMLISKILTAIAGGISEQGKDVLPTDMLNSLGDQLGTEGKKIIESGKDIGKTATEALKGLNPFQKKEKQ